MVALDPVTTQPSFTNANGCPKIDADNNSWNLRASKANCILKILLSSALIKSAHQHHLLQSAKITISHQLHNRQDNVACPSKTDEHRIGTAAQSNIQCKRDKLIVPWQASPNWYRFSSCSLCLESLPTWATRFSSGRMSWQTEERRSWRSKICLSHQREV